MAEHTKQLAMKNILRREAGTPVQRSTTGLIITWISRPYIQGIVMVLQ